MGGGEDIIKATVKELLLDEMTKVATKAEPQQESAAPKRMCPLNNPVLLDVFTEIIADSGDHNPNSSTASELEKYLNDSLINYKTGDPYN